MDLRPKLADDFLDALIGDAREDPLVSRLAWGSILPEEEAKLRERWKGLILERFRNHTIRHEHDANVDGVVAFLEKYPQLQGLIDQAQDEARRRFPGVTFRLDLDNWYDQCHTCKEGQYLSLHIGTQLTQTTHTGNDNSPFDVADDAWREWETTWQDQHEKLEDVSDLLVTHLRWKFDPVEE